jgi:hypothetical protein
MEIRRWTFGVVTGLVFTSLLLPACGGNGGGSGGSCGAVQPCGGAVVGTWTVQSMCQRVEEFTYGEKCPGASLDQSGKTTTGTFTYASDMTFMSTLSQSGALKFKVPLSCAQTATCDEYATLIAPGPPQASTTCATVAGDICDCTLTYIPLTSDVTGTYSTAGNLVTVMAGGIAQERGYCVQDNTFHLINLNSDTGEIRGDIVSTR